MKESHTGNDEATMTITLGRTVALVLDNLLARWRNAGAPFSLRTSHDAEWQTLATIGSALAGALLHRYSHEDYRGQLALARQ